MPSQKYFEQVREREVERSKLSSVIVACHLTKIHVFSTLKPKEIDILVESFSGSWHVQKQFEELKKFHSKLKDVFPFEAGRNGRFNRIIPSLSSGKDIEKIKFYLSSILRLPPYISRSLIVISFLLPPYNEDYSMSILSNKVIPKSTYQQQEQTENLNTINNYSPTISSFSVRSSSTTNTYTLTRLKFMIKDDIVAIDLQTSTSIDKMIECVKSKHFQFPNEDNYRLLYCDQEKEDFICIEDEEDLMVAIDLLGQKLVIHVK